MPDLHRTVYLSSASAMFDASQMEAIRAVSRRNNAMADISGILLHTDGSFLQVIEGPEPSIAELLQRVRGDRRHSGVLVIENGSASERFFPQWSMESRSIDYREMEALHSPHENFATVVERLSASNDAVVVATFLRNFFQTSRSRYAA